MGKIKTAIARKLIDSVTTNNYFIGRYIGTNGSMGFEYNKFYRFRTEIVAGYIVLRTIGGRLYCPYSNMETLFKNWTDIELTETRIG